MKLRGVLQVVLLYGINVSVPLGKDTWGKNFDLWSIYMETSELKAAIFELEARVEKIRDWL